MKKAMIVLALLLTALAPAGWAARKKTASSEAPKDNFCFVVLGDRTNTPNAKAYEMVLRDVERIRPDFVVTVGDFINGYKDSAGTVRDWDETLPALKLLTCPIYLAPGNHDITTPDVRGLFIQKTGRNPYYSFDYQNSHFIIMDNSLVESADKLDPDQMKWLEKDLKGLKNKQGIYIFMHKPFWAAGVGQGKPDKLHDLFKKYKVTAVFTGHWHSYASETYDGIRYVVMGSSGAEIGTENLSLANFYQYMWISTRNGKFHPVLMKAGHTFDPDWVSLKEESFANNQLWKAVDLRGPSFVEGKTPRDFKLELKLTNITEKPIKTEVDWETESNWQPLNPKTPVEIAPGETLKQVFRFKGNGSLYPLPLMKVPYPFGQDKHYNIEKYAPEIAKIVECSKTLKAPEIDGVIKDGEWRNGGKVTEFCGDNAKPSGADSTKFLFMHDKDNLYIAVTCRDTAMSVLKATKTVRDDAVNNDDYVGFFMAANKDTVYQFYINPLGTVWDQMMDKVHNVKDEKWNGNFQIKCERGEKSWTVEMKIPLKDIGITSLGKDTQIRMNLRRRQQHNKQLALWIFNWDYLTQNYGILKFK
jgi:predicted phosphodiesterase